MNLPDNCTNSFDADWWRCEIDRIVSTSDPVLCNLLVTRAHFQLSQALQVVTGANAGANFHTWAVWGSKKAGETIRQEDTRRLRRVVARIGIGCALGLLAASAVRPSLLKLTVAIGLGCALRLGPTLLLQRSLARTRRAVLAGNRTVLEDIGNVTASFVAMFNTRQPFDIEELERFMHSLRDGRTESGGQALLARAFLYYYKAAHEPDADMKHEQMFLANCYAILHEHIRLEPYIRAAMPPLLRRLITTRLLRFHLGREALHVSANVPTANYEAFPETLRELDNPELIAFLEGMGGWDRTPHTLEASGATDWASLNDRMNFIVDLFRSRHLSPNILASPFTEQQEFELLAGRVPNGPL